MGREKAVPLQLELERLKEQLKAAEGLAVQLSPAEHPNIYLRIQNLRTMLDDLDRDKGPETRH